MTREKYESLPLSTLKEVAKTRGLRGISTMKKADLIDLMLEEDDKVSIKEAKEEVKSEKAGTADIEQLDSGRTVNGILEVMDGYGFIRSQNYLPGDEDVYVSPSQINTLHEKLLKNIERLYYLNSPSKKMLKDMGIYESDIDQIIQIIGNSFSSVSDLEKLLAQNYYKLSDISVVSKYIIMRLINS